MNPSSSTSSRLPAIFIGHGSPMNALEENVYTRAWATLGKSLPRPKAILAISAHWLTHETAVTAMAAPRTIHDFGHFPQALFEVRYPAPGSADLAQRVRHLLAPVPVAMDHSWGLDHGTWSVLVKMFPEAGIPVVQMSIAATQTNAFHLALGTRLAPLRDEGILIIASGNVVHNLSLMNRRQNIAHDWARRFNDRVRSCLLRGDVEALMDYASWGDDARLAVPTPEHFTPLLYVAGTCLPGEEITIPVDGIEMGSISMLTAVIGGSCRS